MSKKLEDYSTFIVAMFGLVMLYAMTSADCATGGSCAFANGDLANWLFPKLQFMEWAFWHIVPG